MDPLSELAGRPIWYYIPSDESLPEHALGSNIKGIRPRVVAGCTVCMYSSRAKAELAFGMLVQNEQKPLLVRFNDSMVELDTDNWRKCSKIRVVRLLKRAANFRDRTADMATKRRNFDGHQRKQ